MKRSDWYFVGLMICASNVNVFGAFASMIVMLIAYIAYSTIENKEEE